MPIPRIKEEKKSDESNRLHNLLKRITAYVRKFRLTYNYDLIRILYFITQSILEFMCGACIVAVSVLQSILKAVKFPAYNAIMFEKVGSAPFSDEMVAEATRKMIDGNALIKNSAARPLSAYTIYTIFRRCKN